MQIKILDEKLKSLVKSERKITHEILLLIQTLDLTRSYCELGYSSLFEYLTKEIGYSEGAAQRRISSARLLKEVPSLKKDLESGDLNLSQVSLAQVAFKQENLKTEQKEKVLSKLKGKNSFETKKILLDECPKFELPKTAQPAKNERVHIALVFSQYEWLEVQELLAKVSHKIPEQKLEAALLYWARNNKSKSPPLRRLVDARANGQCEFTSKSGKRCESKHFLEMDHIHPKALGGKDSPLNFRILCRSHNQHEAKIKGLTC